MAYNDKVVDVVVNLGTQPIDTVGFETPLFIAIHQVFDDAVRVYSEPDELIEDGFAAGSPAHKFAVKAFAGKFPPAAVAIGRSNLVNTIADFTGQVNTENVSINVTMGDLKKAIIFPIAGTAAAPDAIASGIAAQVAADDELKDVLTATASGGKVTFTSTKPFSLGKDAGNYTMTDTTDQTVAQLIPELDDDYSNWYFLSTQSHKDSDILAAASYASSNFKFHAYSTADVKTKVAKDSANIMAQLKALSYDTSLGMYDPLADSEFPEAGMIGAMASNDPSYGDSLHLKTMPGVIAPKLSRTEREAIWGHNGNFYRVIRGVGSFYEGKMASGQYADVIRFSHWLKFRLEESVFNHMSNRSNLGLSVKMSDDDLPSLKSVMMNNPINIGVQNGSILTGYDQEAKVFYDPIITIPRRAQIPTADLQARVLRDVKVELVYNNSLHFVKIRASVLTDRITQNTSGQNFTVGA